jgi:hypothetical protein
MTSSIPPKHFPDYQAVPIEEICLKMSKTVAELHDFVKESKENFAEMGITKLMFFIDGDYFYAPEKISVQHYGSVDRS